MHRLMSKRAQSTAEYAVVIAIVLGAVIGMQTYVKRGLQARYKDVTKAFTDSGGTFEGTDLTAKLQYEPYYASQNITTTIDEHYSEKMEAKDKVTRNDVLSGRKRQPGSFTKEIGYSAPDGGW